MSKNKKYRKFGKKILVGASSGIVAGMFLVGATSAMAETTQEYNPPSYSQKAEAKGMHFMHRWNSPSKANSLALTLGLDKQKVKQELKSGKPLKQILQENGVATEELEKAVNLQKSSKKVRMKNKNYF